jgi:hypothetical protein
MKRALTSNSPPYCQRQFCTVLPLGLLVGAPDSRPSGHRPNVARAKLCFTLGNLLPAPAPPRQRAATAIFALEFPQPSRWLFRSYHAAACFCVKPMYLSNASAKFVRPTRFLSSGLTLQDPDRPYLPRYIATQGPLPSTTEDFWAMVLQQKCQAVVSLTRELERDRVSLAAASF